MMDSYLEHYENDMNTSSKKTALVLEYRIPELLARRPTSVTVGCDMFELGSTQKPLLIVLPRPAARP